MLVNGGGASPSVVETLKPNPIVVLAPSRLGENDAWSVACSVVRGDRRSGPADEQGRGGGEVELCS